MNIKIRRLTASALCLALGLLLPQIFHLFGGRTAGSVFSPMHLPIFLAGLLLGPLAGAAVGLLTPLLSALLFAMPPAAMLPFMVPELLAYGFISGLCAKKLPLYPSLLLAQLSGRAVYALGLFLAGTLLQLEVAAPASVLTSVLTGLPGIALQLVVVPPLVHLLKQRRAIA